MSGDRLTQAVCDRIAEQVRGAIGPLGRGGLDVDVRLTDLALDSLDLVEMAIDLQEDHDVWFEEADLAALVTVGDVVALIERRRSEISTARSVTPRRRRPRTGRAW